MPDPDKHVKIRIVTGPSAQKTEEHQAIVPSSADLIVSFPDNATERKRGAIISMTYDRENKVILFFDSPYGRQNRDYSVKPCEVMVRAMRLSDFCDMLGIDIEEFLAAKEDDGEELTFDEAVKMDIEDMLESLDDE